MPETADLMVVHHADGLHEGVADGRTHELEASSLEVLAHQVGRCKPDLPKLLTHRSARETEDCTAAAPKRINGSSHALMCPLRHSFARADWPHESPAVDGPAKAEYSDGFIDISDV